MKKFLLGLLLSLTFTASAVKKDVITLTEDNHAALIGEVDDDNITEVIKKLDSIKGNVAYLYINSPGGSVIAGQRLIQYIETSDKKIIGVAEVAISMAHQILQNTTERVGTPDNVLMQHRMTAGTTGNVDEMAGMINLFKAMETALNTKSADRIGISLSEFFKRVENNWWTYGVESKKQNIVDKISSVKCESSLYTKEKKMTITVMRFIQMPIIINACPIVPVRLDKDKLDGKSFEEVVKLQEYLDRPTRAVVNP